MVMDPFLWTSKNPNKFDKFLVVMWSQKTRAQSHSEYEIEPFPSQSSLENTRSIYSSVIDGSTF